MVVTCQVEGLDRLESVFNQLPALLEGGVKVVGDAAAYALVWEWGSARISKPGPKTVWSVNPDGEPAILTITAPYGYIRVNRDQYFGFLRDEFDKIDLSSVPVSDWASLFRGMLDLVAIRCTQLISDTAPIDTGDLRGSIMPVTTGDGLLEQESTGSEFNIGMEWL